MVGSVHSQLRETCEMGKTLAASTPAAEPRKGHFRSLTKAVSRAKNALLGVFKRRECFSPTRKARTDALFYPPVHRRLTVRVSWGFSRYCSREKLIFGAVIKFCKKFALKSVEKVRITYLPTTT